MYHQRGLEEKWFMWFIWGRHELICFIFLEERSGGCWLAVAKIWQGMCLSMTEGCHRGFLAFLTSLLLADFPLCGGGSLLYSESWRLAVSPAVQLIESKIWATFKVLALYLCEVTSCLLILQARVGVTVTYEAFRYFPFFFSFYLSIVVLTCF